MTDLTPMEKVEILRACCCVAGADGETTYEERLVLESLADDVGVGQASLTAMIERANSDQDFWKEQFSVLKSEPTQSMAIMLEAAMANGEIKDEERVILQNLANRLEVPADVFGQLVSQAAVITQKRSGPAT